MFIIEIKKCKNLILKIVITGRENASNRSAQKDKTSFELTALYLQTQQT